MLRIGEHFHLYNPGNHYSILEELDGDLNSRLTQQPKSILFNGDEENVCLNINLSQNEETKIESSYYIGLDWIHPWKIPVQVEPKMNKEGVKIDYLQMLVEALSEPENFDHLDALMEIKFEDQWIEVDGDQNIQLTPFLILQYLMVVRSIVRKGLKKDYYRVVSNLDSRIKGKILVGEQIKQNVLKNRQTKTVCSYPQFGLNTHANQFLKYVLLFINAQIENYQDQRFKGELLSLIRYNLGAFNQVDEKYHGKLGKEVNPFYQEYNQAFMLGNQILRLLDHNLSKATTLASKYPPHWIDMSKLFELYVFKKLREKFLAKGAVKYHFKTNRQELDFIINHEGVRCVVDAKYKPRYRSGNPSKDDARQLSGYARLNKMYKELEVENDILIPIYIIYPKMLGFDTSSALDFEENFSEVEGSDIQILDTTVRESGAYRKMYLQEIELPFIN